MSSWWLNNNLRAERIYIKSELKGKSKEKKAQYMKQRDHKNLGVWKQDGTK